MSYTTLVLPFIENKRSSPDERSGVIDRPSVWGVVGGAGIRVWPRGARGACEALFALRHRRCSSSQHQQARFISVCNHGAASHLPPASLLRHQVQSDPRGENPRSVIPHHRPPTLFSNCGNSISFSELLRPLQVASLCFRPPRSARMDLSAPSPESVLPG